MLRSAPPAGVFAICRRCTVSVVTSNEKKSGGERQDQHLAIRMLSDRLLVVPTDSDGGERKSTAGILIPATATVGRRLVWAEVVAVGQMVRHVKVGDRVLFDPEERAEVELGPTTYLLLREKDLHAVAAPEVPGEGTGLYL
jgi:chaperonin GroES